MRVWMFGVVAVMSPLAVAEAPNDYPKARQLCSQHISGNSMHITWRSLATVDAMPKVVEFYEKFYKMKSKPGDKGDRVFDFNGSQLWIFPATKADKFPSCEEKAKPGEVTVMLFSQAARP